LHNTDIVRKLCGDVLSEKDPHKAEELISLLQAVIRDDQEEIRLRMAFLAKKYADAISKASDSKAADFHSRLVTFVPHTLEPFPRRGHPSHTVSSSPARGRSHGTFLA
jgi:hypothetical protein